MPDIPPVERDLETLSELLPNYVEAIRDAQFAAQKQYYAAHRNLVESLQQSLKEVPLQEAARSFAEGMQAGWARQDPQVYAEASRSYASALREAQMHVQRRMQDAYKTHIDEVQQTLATAADVQKSEFENFLRSLQNAFARTDIQMLDSAGLARMAQTLLAAAWIRAHIA